jgi:hypothetical protein
VCCCPTDSSRVSLPPMFCLSVECSDEVSSQSGACCWPVGRRSRAPNDGVRLWETSPVPREGRVRRAAVPAAAAPLSWPTRLATLAQVRGAAAAEAEQVARPGNDERQWLESGRVPGPTNSNARFRSLSSQQGHRQQIKALKLK